MKSIYCGIGGEVSARYYDIITADDVEDDRTAEEIIESIRDKLREISEV